MLLVKEYMFIKIKNKSVNSLFQLNIRSFLFISIDIVSLNFFSWYCFYSINYVAIRKINFAIKTLHESKNIITFDLDNFIHCVSCKYLFLKLFS